MIISIITPIYKGKEYIPKLMKMIDHNAKKLRTLNPETRVEYILVNDSPEEKITFEKEGVEGLSYELILLTNDRNLGVHASRVNGLKRASGEYISFLDQDDEISDDFLFLQYKRAKEKPEADVIVCNAYKETEKGKEIWYPNQMRFHLVTKKKYYIWIKNQIISPGQCLIKKESIPSAWCENIVNKTGADDLMLWILMFAAESKYAINEELLYIHKNSGNNVSLNAKKMYASFEETAVQLRNTGSVSEHDLKIMHRYHYFKYKLHTSSSHIEKIGCCFVNLDFVAFHLFYKLIGAIKTYNNVAINFDMRE